MSNGDAAAAAAGDAAATSPAQGAPGSGDQPTTNEFVNSLPEDIRGNESLQSYQDAGSLAKDFVDLKGKVPVVPEGPDQYQVAYPDGYPDQAKFTTGILQAFHSAGLSQGQVEKLVESHVNMVNNQVSKVNEAQEQAVQSLKNEWKGDYTANVQMVQKVVHFAGGDELKNLCNVKISENMRLGDHPVFLKAMAKIGGLLSEDVLETGPAVTTPDQIERTDAGTGILSSYKNMGKKS